MAIVYARTKFQREKSAQRTKLKTILKNSGWVGIIKQIKNNNIDVNVQNGYLLELAVKSKNIDAMKELIALDVHFTLDNTYEGMMEKSLRVKNPLFLAVKGNQKEMINLLLPQYFQWGSKEDNDERFKFWQKDHEYSTRHLNSYLTQFIWNSNIEAFNYLINFAPFLINEQNKKHEEIILLATIHISAVNFFENLKEKGIDPLKHQDKMFSTVIRNGNVKVLDWLIKNGANISSDNNHHIMEISQPGAYNSHKSAECVKKNGIDIHFNKNELLLNAIANKHHRLINYLWDQLSSSNKKEMAVKCLWQTVKSQQIEIVNIFLPLCTVDEVKKIRDKMQGKYSETSPFINNYIFENDLFSIDTRIKRKKI